MYPDHQVEKVVNVVKKNSFREVRKTGFFFVVNQGKISSFSFKVAHFLDFEVGNGGPGPKASLWPLVCHAMWGVNT